MCKECIPCAATMENNKIIEVFCQSCARPMTQREHKEYFDKYIPWFEKKFNIVYSRERPDYDFGDVAETLAA